MISPGTVVGNIKTIFWIMIGIECAGAIIAAVHAIKA
jgi:hypothetical protein